MLMGLLPSFFQSWVSLQMPTLIVYLVKWNFPKIVKKSEMNMKGSAEDKS